MSKFPPSSSYFEAIGRMAVYIAYVEEQVESCYERVFRNQHVYKPRKPISDKVQQLRQHFQGALNFENLCDFTIDLLDERNKILHGRIYGNRSNKSPQITHLRSNTIKQIISIKAIDDVHLSAYQTYLCWQRFK